ncbi:hypothetical protein AO88_03957, partial [Mycobacterium tuberculosis M2138]
RLPTTLNARDQPPAEVSDQRVSGLTGAVHLSPRAALMDGGWDVRGVAVDPQPKFGDPQRADIDDQPKKEWMCRGWDKSH